MRYALQYNDVATVDLAAPLTLATQTSDVDALDNLTARAWVSFQRCNLSC